MTIVFLTRGFYPQKKGGVELFTYEASKRLTGGPLQIYVITEYLERTKHLETLNKVFIQRIKFVRTPIYIVNSLLYFFKVFRTIRAMKPDVIHACQTNFNGVYGAFIAKILPIKIIIHEHGKFFDLPIWHKVFFAKAALWNADCLLAPSKGLAQEMEKLAKREVRVIPNAVDLEDYIGLTKKKAREELGISENKRIVLFVGRLTPVKSLDTLISSIDIVKREVENVELILVGEGESEKNLRNLVSEKNLGNVVTFVGDVKHGLIPTYMAMCDVFVLPSNRESFGIVLLEAMAAGKPCVASNVGGIPEIIEDKKNGILVNPGDKHKLADAIKRVLEEKEIADFYGRNNRIKAKDFSWGKVIGELRNVYEELVRGYK